MKRSLSSISFILAFFWLFGQSTMGTLSWNENAMEGYTFFSPFSGTKAYMIDNCGRVVNQWDRGTRPGLSAYFLENGMMLRTYKPNPTGPFTSASNSGGIELVDWDNNTVWHYEHNTPTEISHHDAVMLPNGNILMLTWELVYEDELIELGRDPDEIASEGFMWSERIMEIMPIETDEMVLIWEWRIKDHYIQDFDESKSNFGVVSEHPERFNINLPELNSNNSNASRDWNHFNAIDYNEELDQILISVRNSDEIWIIDHSTTTEEATSSEGGTYGQGGDILYRWGNAYAYDRAPLSDEYLYGQHGVNWIKTGLEDEGKIMIYNNGNGQPGQDFSRVHLLDPPQDSPGFYIIPEEDPIGPDEPEWTYGNGGSTYFWSPYLSNVHRLPNGNTLVNAGSGGYIFELDSDENRVWEYLIPLYGDTPGNQGGTINNNGTFRAYKYPLDYPGFEGKELMAGETIENGENPVECEGVMSSVQPTSLLDMNIQLKYQLNGIQTRLVSNSNLPVWFFLYDTNGKICQIKKSQTNAWIEFNDVLTGLYVLKGVTLSGQQLVKKIIISN